MPFNCFKPFVFELIEAKNKNDEEEIKVNFKKRETKD